MNDSYFIVPDGIDAIRKDLPGFVELLARTARWVNPEAFRSLPVWYPEIARGHSVYDAQWGTIRANKQRGLEVKEANIWAGKALVGALGARKTPNWTVCHIWGRDDPKFQSRNAVVQDPRFYSCIGNMIWLPTPLKGFTDAVPEVKLMLRVCAFHTYGWACEHETVRSAAEVVTSGAIPEGYPASWPRRLGDPLPPGTAPFSARVISAIAKRKQKLKADLLNDALGNYPRDRVREALEFWKIEF